MNPYSRFVADHARLIDAAKTLPLGGFSPTPKPGLAPDAPRLDLWVYDYGRLKDPASPQAEFGTLVVFVHDGRFDGYLRLPGSPDASAR